MDVSSNLPIQALGPVVTPHPESAKRPTAKSDQSLSDVLEIDGPDLANADRDARGDQYSRSSPHSPAPKTSSGDSAQVDGGLDVLG